MKAKKRRQPIHRNIRRRRLELQLTQEQLAERIGTDKTVISHWERAESAPRAKMMPRVAAALEMTADELLLEAS